MRMLLGLGVVCSLLAEPSSSRAGDGKDPAGKTLDGHSKEVNSVAFSPDGKLLASASNDRTIKLWDPATGKEVSELTSGFGKNAVAFSPDGTVLAAACTGRIELWDLRGRKLSGQLAPGGAAVITAVAFSADGKTLASTGFDGQLRIWDVAGRKELKSFAAHAGRHTAVAFSADGKLLASAGAGAERGRDTAWCEVKLWDTADWKETGALRGEEGMAMSVTISPDGKTVAAGTWMLDPKLFKTLPGNVLLWDVAERKLRQTLRGHGEPVTSVAFNSDGTLLVSGSSDRTLRVWGTADGKEVAILKGHTDHVTSAAFSPGGRTVVSGSRDRSVKLWELKK